MATIRRLGVWRSLVARSVRVGEVPSSNLGTPIHTGQRKRSRGRRLREQDARPTCGVRPKVQVSLSSPCFSDRGGRKSASPPCGFPCWSLAVFLACCGVASGRSGTAPRRRRRRPQVDGGHEGRRLQPPGRRLQGGPRHAAVGSPGRRSSTTTARTYMRRAQAAAKLGHRVVRRRLRRRRPRRRSSPRRARSTAPTSSTRSSRAKNVNDVVIWNEANSALFWRPQQGARRLLRGAARRAATTRSTRSGARST